MCVSVYGYKPPSNHASETLQITKKENLEEPTHKQKALLCESKAKRWNDIHHTGDLCSLWNVDFWIMLN